MKGSTSESKPLREKQIRILESLSWDEWLAHERSWNLRRFPEADPAF
jgi:hypothetical protein